MRVAVTRLLAIGLTVPLGVPLGISLGVPLGVTLFGAAPGFAQTTGPGGTGMARGLGRDVVPAKPEAAPPVLPGTKAPGEAAAPTQPVASMTPTEALFDAINRGDIATARDAVNRGARTETANELGLTALDLAVDLGRNDISFYLLSIRTDDPGTRRDADRRDIPLATPAAAEPRRRIATVTQRGPAEEPVESVPRYSSGYGGSPIPAAGFLGFGGR